MGAQRWVTNVERLLESTPLLSPRSTPTSFRIESYGGHGGPAGVMVRGRVLDNPAPSRAAEGEGVGAAVRRSVQNFLTRELAGVPLTVEIGGTRVRTVSDDDGYFLVRASGADRLGSPWASGSVSLDGDYRGLTSGAATTTSVDVRVPGPEARIGIISDIDDTVIKTGVQRAGQMVLQTLAGSELTREAFPGAAALYRDLAAEVNPVFYVSSSPWNLHAFLSAFLEHHDFPRGPVLLRDLLGTRVGREQKHGRIREILDLHPDLRFVLIGDSGEKDPEIYADIVRSHPGRILAVYIREVRLDPGDGTVEQVAQAWAPDVPFVLAADSQAVRRHAQTLGLL
ncbi:App1 family protein [Aeromicrobium chenweiae]|nr:phosphatase domain-containing protein [Aeromicrobium chenweiae]